MATDQLLVATPEAASPPARAPLSWRPILCIAGTVAVMAAVLDAITARPLAAAPTAAATLALIVWLAIYRKISAPVNEQLTTAATQHRTAPGARDLQRTWDRVIGIRALLQGIALAALCAALAI